MTTREEHPGDRKNLLASSATTVSSAALKRFSWTTFEDLLDCLATVHQRLWVITNELSLTRTISDNAVLQVCEVALNNGDSTQKVNGSPPHHAILDIIRATQLEQSRAWTQHVEEMEIAICAAAPIVVELEACARLWSKGALPPAVDTATNRQRTVGEPNTLGLNDATTLLTTSATPSKAASSPPSMHAAGLIQLHVEDSAGAFSRSEQSHNSTSHSPPNILVRRPSSAALIHPTSFRHEHMAHTATYHSTTRSRSIEQEQSPRDAAINTRHHQERRLDDFDDSISIVAVESERATPADSTGGGASQRIDDPSPKLVGLLGPNGMHSSLVTPHEQHTGGSSIGGGSTRTQGHHQLEAPYRAPVMSSLTRAAEHPSATYSDIERPLAVLRTQPLGPSPSPPTHMDALDALNCIGSGSGINASAASRGVAAPTQSDDQRVRSVNAFVSAHNWLSPSVHNDDVQLSRTLYPQVPSLLRADVERLPFRDMSKHGVLYQDSKRSLDSIPSAAELLAQRRQARR